MKILWRLETVKQACRPLRFVNASSPCRTLIVPPCARRIRSFRIAAREFRAYDPRTVGNGWRQSMLVRLILFVAILLQVAGVSTVAARAQSHSLSFRAVVCKSDAIPAAPHAPGEHDGSCSDCIACCDAQPQIFCVYDQVARLSFPTARTQRSRSSDPSRFPNAVGDAAGARLPRLKTRPYIRAFGSNDVRGSKPRIADAPGAARRDAFWIIGALGDKRGGADAEVP